MSRSERMDEEQARATIWRCVGRIGTCMMVTVVGSTVRARPMRGLARPDENVIWFAADRDSVACQDGAAIQIFRRVS